MSPTDLPTTGEEVLSLSPRDADRVLTILEGAVPRRAGIATLSTSGRREAIVFGDSHGDWRSSGLLLGEFEASGPETLLIGLGDYIDRPPADCGEGSVANAVVLLSAVARHPDRVLLIQGNHEASRQIGASPHHLPGEVERLWGPDPSRYARLMALLERGPLAATTSNGAYLAHAGFPRQLPASNWRSVFDAPSEAVLLEVLWGECGESRIRRGASPAWTARELDRFLAATALSVMLRGHDPDLAGVPSCGGRVLTLHTTRTYERYGGVISARVPLDRALRSVADLAVEHLPTEGHVYPAAGRRGPPDRSPEPS